MRTSRAAVAAAILAAVPFGCGHGGHGHSIGSYVESLPAWPTPSPDARVAGGSSTDWVTGSDGRSYACTDTPYSLTSTPDKVTTFDPNADVLWPGALLQGKPLQNGSLEGLPLTERAPLEISIPGLLAANNTITVDHPDLASVQQAVGSLVNAAVQEGVHASSSVNFHKVEAFSASQSALDLGFSGSYIGFDLQTSLGLSDSANLHSVVVSFVQKMFTVTVPEPESPADFFDGLTSSEIQQQIDAGHLGPDNLPVYVSGVTYGRVLMFSVVSSRSTAQIEAALNAQYDGLVGGGSVAASYAALLSDSTTSIHLVTVGGSATNAEAAIHDGNPDEYFESDPPISTGVPISYTIRYLRDNKIAAVSETTSYTVHSCVETTSGPGANYFVIDKGQNAVVAFDTTGRQMALTYPIGVPQYLFTAGLTWDSVDDRFLLAWDNGSSTAVDVYRPDGHFEYAFDTGDQTGARRVSYDPKYDRVYATSGYAVSAWSPQGHLQKAYSDGHFPVDAVFDGVNDVLYMLEQSGSIFTVAKLGFDGTVLQTSGTFDGMQHPIAIAFDPVSQHVFTASDWQMGGGNIPFVSVYDTDGNPVTTFPILDWPTALLWKDGRLYIPTAGGFVLQYLPDGTAVQQANDTFTGISSGLGIAYRP